MIKKIFIAFLIWKSVIFIYTMHVSHLFPDIPYYQAKNLFSDRYHELIWRFANMDGLNYLRIARNGYNLDNIPFFPLYPLIVRFFANTFFHHRYFTPISQIVSNLSFLASLFVTYKIIQKDRYTKLFPTILLIMISFPTAFFYGASYNDSLFFLLASLSIYSVRRYSLFSASMWGALATLVRLNGVVLFVFILTEHFIKANKIEYFPQFLSRLPKFSLLVKKAFSLKQIIRKKLYLTFIIPASFLSFLLYIQLKFGNWHLLFSTMKIWGQDRIILLPQVFWRYFKILVVYPTFKLNYWIAAIELLFVIFYIFILAYSFNKLRISYWIFMFFSFLIPSLTGTFAGMPRYGLHLYPLFLSTTLFLNSTNSLVRILYFTTSIFLLFVMLAFYVNGYFVA